MGRCLEGVVVMCGWGVLVGSVADLILGSLCCETAEEAKSLIPSMQNKMSDASLQEVLDELTKLRTFTD
jgi:hypothetical protein